MDIRENPVTSFLGECLGFFAPMNGGKTEAMIQELKRAGYYGLNSIAYNHSRNTREKDSIVIDGKEPYPGKTVSSMAELRADLEMRIENLKSQKIGLQGTNGEIVLQGVHHQKDLPLRAIGIDEVNLFCLTEEETVEMLDFMQWSRQSEHQMVLYVSGLLYDFRHLPFAQVHSLLPYIDRREEKKPACMAIGSDKKKCIHTAKHTQRVWSIPFVEEAGLAELLSGMEYFDFRDKSGKDHFKEYVPAPFFDDTVRIEEVKDGRIIYLPVCNHCARLPFKTEVFAVYDAICHGDQRQDLLPSQLLFSRIIDFLSNPIEDWIRKDKTNGLYLPTQIHRNKIGGYSKEPRRN